MVAARAQLIFVDSFFVHVVYECVCLCTRMFLCMSASIFLCIPFFCRPPSSDVDVGAAGRVILSRSCCYIHVLYVPMYMYMYVCLYINLCVDLA